MATIDIIRALCTKNNTSIKALEKELGFSNGSLAKASTIKDDRLQKIAEYFNVSVDYLMTGEDKYITPHYESFGDVEYVKNLIQSLGYTAYATASERFGNSFIVQKSDDDKSVLIRNSEIHVILSQIEKAKSDIVQQVITEKYENQDYYIESSEAEAHDNIFRAINDAKTIKDMAEVISEIIYSCSDCSPDCKEQCVECMTEILLQKMKEFIES